MADSKITALTALTAADPANDMIPIVDVSDTPPASGNTKRISINNLLACSPSATLASATISGDLTVNKNTNGQNRLVLSNPNTGTGAYDSIDFIAGTASNQILSMGSGYTGSFPYLTGALLLRSNQANGIVINTGGSAAAIQFGINDTLGMTLNSTGLGVGVAPSYKVDVSATTNLMRINSASGNDCNLVLGQTGVGNWMIYNSATAGLLKFQFGGNDRVTIDQSGNVGVGVTPSAWATSYKAFQIGQSASLSGFSSELAVFGSNCYFDTTDSRWERITSGFTSQYYQTSGTHVWRTGGTAGANTDCAFTQAMTLDASGNLFIGKAATGLGTVGIQGSPSGWIQATVSGDSSLFTNRLASDGKTVQFYRQTLEVGNISVTTTGATFNSTSDYRLKEAVAPLSGGLARVNALKPSVYKWKSNGLSGEGFLAHELAEVVPSAVNGEKDAVNEDGSINAQSIDMSRVVPILVAAIQELAAEVNALKNA